MRLKKLVATTLSASILFSSALSSGSLLFATEPGEDSIEDSFFDSIFQGVSYLDSRSLCLLKEDEFYLEPITKEFLEHMVDIIRKLCSEKVRPTEIGDSGYVGNVLLRHSSYAKTLFFSNASDVKEFVDMSKTCDKCVSFYDSLFYIYWIILRTYSSVCYKHRDEIINMDKVGKDSDSYWNSLQKVYCIRGLLMNLAIAKVFTNKCTEYKAFEHLIKCLGVTVVDFIKSIKPDKVPEKDFLEWLGINCLNEKELNKLTGKVGNLLFGSCACERTDDNVELKLGKLLTSTYTDFSNVLAAENRLILLEKFFVIGCPISVRDGKPMAARPVLEIAASKEVKKKSESIAEQYNEIKKINAETEKIVKDLEVVVAKAEKSCKFNVVNNSKELAASSERKIKKLAEKIEILANESKKLSDLAVKKSKKLGTESERVTELNGAINFVEAMVDPLCSKEWSDTAKQEAEEFARVSRQTACCAEKAETSVANAYTIVEEFKNIVKKTEGLVARAGNAAKGLEERRVRKKEESEKQKRNEERREVEKQKCDEERREAKKQAIQEEKSKEVAVEEKARKQQLKQEHLTKKTTVNQSKTREIQDKLKKKKELTSKSETFSVSGSSLESESSEEEKREAEEIAEKQKLENMFTSDSKQDVELRVDGEQGKYRLIYSPLLFEKLRGKINKDDVYKNKKYEVMEVIRQLWLGGPESFGQKRGIKNLSSLGEAQKKLQQKYDQRVVNAFIKSELKKFTLYKYSLTQEIQLVYYVNNDAKQIYVTDNTDHVDKN